MQSDNPDIQWALDLLKYDPLNQPSFFSKYFTQIPCVLTGIFACCYINHVRGFRPFARIHHHVLVTGAMLLGTNYIEKLYHERTARRDAVLRDYIIRHPEDFPPPERKKYGELFLEWVPIR